MSRDQFWLTKAEFSKIKPHLPTDTRGKARVDDRRVISGIVQVRRSQPSFFADAVRAAALRGEPAVPPADGLYGGDEDDRAFRERFGAYRPVGTAAH